MTATLSPPEPDTALDYPETLLISSHPDTDLLGEDDVPEAFYTTNAPGNHIGKAGTYTRKTSWFLYRAILPQLDDDVDLSLTSLAKDLGISYSKLLGYIRAHYRMRQLPLVTEVQGQHWILDLTKLRIIDRELHRLDSNPDHLEAIDAALADFLTPTAPNQTVPTDAELRRFIRGFIDTHLRPGDKEEKPQPTLRINYNPDNTTTLSLTCDSATATIIARHIDVYTNKAHTTAAQGLIDLILEDTHTSVAINTFTTNPETNSVYVPGAGWININHALTDNTFIRRLNADEVDSYIPNADIRAYTQGRDATCRWPGCTIPATQCQLDHRIEYHQGGPTSPDNLVNLCQHHHNIKTDRRVHYILDPITGTIAWLHRDGTYQLDHATGPLATHQTHWNHTWAQYLALQHQRTKRRVPEGRESR
ncbi:HNH endonuclease signature motif containing protein [Corynebacterium kefirresidentii]|uniref:HNH endonuclease signature motif containing protein n=1 Tax=Corynebacterium kefirresidentii TaxID=1979527 RepID=A0ABT8Q6V4_9CORY|nr:HNH endonuclease signature motif containing protein [Corynebacterium kefirresidentii]MDN8620558.1 HNH endonuclease signature motif containing protein [Corynebacterium kefirresidentii]MDN8641207.1 HNH endonuclease signature motif containing protein [Corynebacterium kefirresidentii]